MYLPQAKTVGSCESHWTLFLSPAWLGVLFSLGTLSNTPSQALWGCPGNARPGGFSHGGGMTLWQERKHLLNTCCVLGPVLDLRDMAQNKTAGGLCANLGSAPC